MLHITLILEGFEVVFRKSDGCKFFYKKGKLLTTSEEKELLERDRILKSM